MAGESDNRSRIDTYSTLLHLVSVSVPQSDISLKAT